VREEVLIKAKKLYPLQFGARTGPLRLHPPRYEARVWQQKVEALLSLSRKEAEKRLRLLDEEAPGVRWGTGSLCGVHRQSQRANTPAKRATLTF